MRPTKDDPKTNSPKARLEVEIEKKLVDQISEMEKHTKISKEELVATAIKRFVATHKDYFPE